MSKKDAGMAPVMLLSFLVYLLEGKESVRASSFGHKAALSLEPVAIASQEGGESSRDEFSNDLSSDLE